MLVKSLRSRVPRRTAGSCAVVLACVVSTTARAQDGGLPLAVYAERAQLLAYGGNWEESHCDSLPDGGSDCGGAWLPARRAMATGAELAQLRAENAALKAGPPVLSAAGQAWGWTLFAVGLLLGGGGVAWLWWTVGR